MNSKGFTLLEILIVLAIIGILAAVGTVKFIRFDNSAAKIVLRDAVAKFNDTEKHHWTNLKLSEYEYESDDQVFDLVKEDLIKTLTWQSISPTGGVVMIKNHSFNVVRQPSTRIGYAIWKEASNGG